MATIIANTSTSSIAAAFIVRKPSNGTSTSSILGLPAIWRTGRVSCSAEEKHSASGVGRNMGMGASLAAARCAMSMSGPALALADERMSTEGTGLSLGLSNNLLGWILLGVFALIWSLYIVHTSTLEVDEESGLSL